MKKCSQCRKARWICRQCGEPCCAHRCVNKVGKAATCTSCKYDKPKTVRVIILAGQTFRGTLYFEDTAFDLSDNYAEHVIAQGIGRAV